MDNKRINILLVEDNPEDVAFTRIILKSSGLDCNLVVSKDGKEAIESLERLAKDESRLPDMILLDINLPVVGGIDVLNKLKQNSKFCNIPVVMLTGSNFDNDIKRSYDLGASTYLVKPISRDALMQVIENLFG